MGVMQPDQRCAFCGARDWAPAYADYRWRDAVIRNVPAVRCRACGELFFDALALVDLEARAEKLGVRGKVEFISLFSRGR